MEVKCIILNSMLLLVKQNISIIVVLISGGATVQLIVCPSKIPILCLEMAVQFNDSTTFDGLLVNTTESNSTLISPIPLSTIITVTICIIGILANSLVLMVIILSSLRTSDFINLIMCLAICDTICLFSVIHAQRGIFGELLIKPSLLFCRFNYFCTYVTGIISSWVTVLISVERYIAIFYPFKAHIYCTKKRMLVAVIIITILACTSQIPLFFTCSLVFIGKSKMRQFCK